MFRRGLDLGFEEVMALSWGTLLRYQEESACLVKVKGKFKGVSAGRGVFCKVARFGRVIRESKQHTSKRSSITLILVEPG